jgi:hypothetical protein
MSENTHTLIPPAFPTHFNRHCIRTDAGGRITDGKSVIEDPGEGWIFLYEGMTQFRLFPDGPENPPLTENVTVGEGDEIGTYSVPKYRYEDGVLERTAAEMTADAEALHLAALPGILRAKRDRLLAESDWSQLDDVPLTDDLRAAWAAYRHALRDITEQPGWPADVVWPVKPA